MTFFQLPYKGKLIHKELDPLFVEDGMRQML